MKKKEIVVGVEVEVEVEVGALVGRKEERKGIKIMKEVVKKVVKAAVNQDLLIIIIRVYLVPAVRSKIHHQIKVIMQNKEKVQKEKRVQVLLLLFRYVEDKLFKEDVQSKWDWS